MKILIAVDMEGITGVVDWDHVTPETADYERFRTVMTDDVNVAVRTAFEHGADEVIVTDGHEYGRNILLESLEPRARLNCGCDSPLAIVQGVETGVDAAMFVGFHARMGTPNGLLCHTWSGVVANLWLNDVLTGETGLVAAVCGYYNVPVIMVSGDAAVCEEARGIISGIETAVVKTAHGRLSAECLPVAEARQAIYDAARQAMQKLRPGKGPVPYRIADPVKVTLECMEAEMADRIEKVAGTKRLDARKVEYTAQDMLEAYRVFRQYNDLGGGEA
jgi:D-amino peptidase